MAGWVWEGREQGGNVNCLIVREGVEGDGMGMGMGMGKGFGKGKGGREGRGREGGSRFAGWAARRDLRIRVGFFRGMGAWKVDRWGEEGFGGEACHVLF